MPPDLDVRARIAREATRLFAAQGYAGTSVREIVQAAGVTKPTLYYYFGNKEGLFTTLVDEYFSAWVDTAQELIAAEGSPLERMLDYVRTTIRGAAEQPDVLRFVAMAYHQSGQGAPAVDCNRFIAEEAKLLAALAEEASHAGELRPELQPADVAMSLMGMVHFRVGANIHASVPLTDEAAEAIVQIFRKGVESP